MMMMMMDESTLLFKNGWLFVVAPSRRCLLPFAMLTRSSNLLVFQHGNTVVWLLFFHRISNTVRHKKTVSKKPPASILSTNSNANPFLVSFLPSFIISFYLNRIYLPFFPSPTPSLSLSLSLSLYCLSLSFSEIIQFIYINVYKGKL